MHKVYVALLVITCSLYSIFAQTIEPGKYLSVMKFDHFTGRTLYNAEYRENITLLDSSNFIYIYSDDITHVKGSGKYTVKKDSFMLEFNEHKEIIDTSIFRILDSVLTDKDSIDLDIKVTNENEPLEYAFIGYYKGSELIKKKGSNKKGKVKFRISKKDIGGQLQIAYAGFNSVIIFISNAYNKKIDVILNEGRQYQFINKGERITYKIKDVDSDGFYAIGSIFSKWTFFKLEVE